MKSVHAAIRVFEAVAAHQPVGLSELARSLDMPKPSVQRALNTLLAAGWLRHDLAEPGKWVVTAHFAVLADVAPAEIAVRDAAHPHLRALQAETDMTVGLFVLDGDRMAVVAGLQAPVSPRAIELARGPLPVHVSAAGRAILSRLPLATRRQVLGTELRRYTERSLVDPGAVLDEIAVAEEAGYAVVRDEYQLDVSAVAAPVLDRMGLPLAAVNVVMPTSSLSDAQAAALGDVTVRCATAMSADMLRIAREA